MHNHNPWAPDPDDGDIRTIHFNSGGNGGGTGFSFTRTYTFGGRPNDPQQRSINAQNAHDAASAEIMRNFETMFTGILGPATRMRGGTFGGQININGRTHTFGSGTYDNTASATMPMGPPEYEPFQHASQPIPANFMPSLMSIMFGGGSRGPRSPGGTFDLFSQLLNPANARSGDHVWSQEAFDRVMSQLMEQNQQNGAPPASDDQINALPKKKIDKSMLGSDDKAECSICMESVEIGTEVTVLPCQHWFHFECIKSWLSEHDTCPHCRKAITPEGQQASSPRQSGRRRSSRRSSSVASPITQVRSGSWTDAGREGGRQNPIPIPDDPSPSALRSAREQYYGRSESSRYRNPEEERGQRPSSERRSSRRSTGSGGGREEGGGGGGVGSWLRNRMPFS